ncbi:MAG: WecB/TagA/CpsF family glycosyltransferase [Verrucomicrobia bacterium]|nr:WecB/TagA/CpsF family glycosyltransferase [Verrucomicrobiota bacterium]
MLNNEHAIAADAYFDPELEVARRRLSSPPQPATAPPIAMLGVVFNNLSLPATVARIEKMIAARTPRYIVTANVDFLVQSQRDAELHRALLDAHLVVCDGTPLVWASRLLGNPLPERVAGSDLVPELISVAAKKGYRLFFLGATPGANEQAIANVRKQFPNLDISGYSPPFRPLSAVDNEEIIARIRAARPDILCVAFGCPKAEKWMVANLNSLGVPVTIGVGGTIDFLAGRLKRAPLWMQRAGIEWLFRLWQEPRRLFRRYVADLWHFGCAMLAQLWYLKLHFGPMTRRKFSCQVISEPTWCRIRMPEQVDATLVRHDRWILEDACDCHCLLDLSDATFVDSSGIGLLLQLRKQIQSAGKCLVLIAPSNVLRRALEVMRVKDLFLIAQDAIEARMLIKGQGRKPEAGCTSKLDNFLHGAPA